MNLDQFDSAVETALASGDVESLDALLEIAERETRTAETEESNG